LIVRRRQLRGPAFDSFLKMAKQADKYCPSRGDLESLFAMISRYAARQGFRLRLGNWRAWWRSMLEWRQWASANPERAKRFLRRSRQQFLDCAVKTIDAQTASSPFRWFLRLLRNYFRAVSKYPRPLSALLRGFLDFLDGCDAAGVESVDLGHVETILDRMAAREKRPQKMSMLIAAIRAELVSSRTSARREGTLSRKP